MVPRAEPNAFKVRWFKGLMSYLHYCVVIFDFTIYTMLPCYCGLARFDGLSTAEIMRSRLREIPAFYFWSCTSCGRLIAC